MKCTNCHMVINKHASKYNAAGVACINCDQIFEVKGPITASKRFKNHHTILSKHAKIKVITIQDVGVVHSTACDEQTNLTYATSRGLSPYTLYHYVYVNFLFSCNNSNFSWSNFNTIMGKKYVENTFRGCFQKLCVQQFSLILTRQYI